jgi:hypothetical protein
MINVSDYGVLRMKTHVVCHKSRDQNIAHGATDEPNLETIQTSQLSGNFAKSIQPTVTAIGFPVNRDRSSSCLLITPCVMPDAICTSASCARK